MTLPRSAPLALMAVCLAGLLFGLEISSVPVILPLLKARLGADFQDLQWVMNAYTIACTTVLMATGTLADRFGRRRVFSIAVAAFGIASLLCGIADGTGPLIAARFVQGLAGGAMFICSIAILSQQYPDEPSRGRAFAIWGVVAGVGLGFGPVIGGAILAVASWHWVFLVHAPLAVIGLMLTGLGVAESRDPDAHRQSLDWAGIGSLSVVVLALTSLITQGGSFGWTGATSLALAATTAVGLFVFVRVERHHPRPMFDFSVFRIRDFSGAILGCIGMNCSYWPFMIYLPLYLATVLGLDTPAVGLAMLVYTVPFLVMPPLAQWLLQRYRARVVIPGGLALIGLGFLGMTWSTGGTHGLWRLLPGALLAGIGLGLTTTPATNMTTSSVPAHRAGMASGMDVSARLITLAINIAMMGLVLVAGIRSVLDVALGPAADVGLVSTVAELLAGGDVGAAREVLAGHPSGAADAALQAAMTRGFGWVLLYGALCASLTAALSFAVLRPRTAAS